ncbi:MAG: class I SAM-dependent methyltransferase [Lachnospiraceae bacterium]|nr:class I SAM-dependent methyltransferase [Lachnospiraceae bacterium]
MKLSERLITVAKMVTPGLKVADVGCDHGHLAIYLVENKIAPFVYAMDVNKGPLERARVNIERDDCAHSIKTILSDGLKELKPGEGESVVMAGMGGPLMAEILEASKEVCREAREFILQPQSEIAMVRHYLQDHGYSIKSEDMVYEDEKFYTVIKAVHGDMNWDREVFFQYGKILIKERNPILLQYLYMQRKKLGALLGQLVNGILTDRIKKRIEEVKEELIYNEQAISIMEETHPVEIERVLK